MCVLVGGSLLESVPCMVVARVCVCVRAPLCVCVCVCVLVGGSMCVTAKISPDNENVLNISISIRTDYYETRQLRQICALHGSC